MAKALIKLAYRQVITHESSSAFEKSIFHDSYGEFLLQIQTYNADKKYTTWQAIQAEIPKAKQNIPYKVNFAIGLYMKSLQNQIPASLDNAGVRSLPFVSHEFGILESDITDRSRHEVSLTYFTDVMTLYEIAGEYMIVAVGDQRDNPASVETMTIRMQQNLTVVEYHSL